MSGRRWKGTEWIRVNSEREMCGVCMCTYTHINTQMHIM